MDQSKKLAIFGGEPVRDTYLSYGKQFIDADDIDTVIETLQSTYLTQGPKIDEFEQRIANYVGAKYAVAFSNGTAALHGACYAVGIGSGDEVITSPMTFAASANCVRYCEGTVVFADIDPITYNIDVKQIEQKITSKTKAIIPVDYTGQPVDLDEIMALAKEFGLVVIEDAAHSLGATYKNRKIGSIADMTMFSFHPVKHITTGEGGIITTDSKEFYERLLVFRTHGITRDKTLLENDPHGPWYMEMVDLGYNYRITDIQAALGISQCNKLDRFVSQRKEIAGLYNHLLAEFDSLILPYQKEERESSWHLYVIQVNLSKVKCSRREIFEALQKENIGVNVHYIPVYFHPYYQRLGYEKGICPIAEDIYEGLITLPLFPAMTGEDVEDVVSALRKVLNYYAK